MSRIQFLFFKIMSWSPVFRITDDSSFNRIDRDSTECRFSLFSLNIGIISFYFFTWDASKRFKWMYKLSLYEAQKFEHNVTNFENEYDIYLAELENKGNININAEKDFLTQRISEIENLKNKTFNKFLAYVAIFVFVLPLYAPKLPNLLPMLTSYKFVYVIVMGYIIANLTFLTIEIIKVKKVKRVSFSEIRNASGNKVEKKLNAMLFYEWKHHNNESTFDVAVIRNIEKYMGLLIFWSIFIIVSSNVEQGIKTSNENIQVRSDQKDVAIVTLQTGTKANLNELIKKNEKMTEEIEDNILQGRYKKVIVVSEYNNKLSSDLIRLLELYKDKNVSIIDVRKKKYPEHIEVILVKE
jgi:hypothetical protein